MFLRYISMCVCLCVRVIAGPQEFKGLVEGKDMVLWLGG